MIVDYLELADPKATKQGLEVVLPVPGVSLGLLVARHDAQQLLDRYDDHDGAFCLDELAAEQQRLPKRILGHDGQAKHRRVKAVQVILGGELHLAQDLGVVVRKCLAREGTVPVGGLVHSLAALANSFTSTCRG